MTYAFTTFDLRNLADQAGRIALMVVIVLGFALSLPIAGIAVFNVVIAITLTVGTPFLADEQGRLDTLYATSPVGRRSVVAGRYLTMIVFGVLLGVLGIISTMITAPIRHLSIDWTLVSQLAALATVTTAVLLAVQLPIFFRLGFTRARMMMYLPVLVLGVAVWGLNQLGVLDVQQFVALATLSPLLVWVAAIVVSAVVLVASAAVATRWYERRAL